MKFSIFKNFIKIVEKTIEWQCRVFLFRFYFWLSFVGHWCGEISIWCIVSDVPYKVIYWSGMLCTEKTTLLKNMQNNCWFCPFLSDSGISVHIYLCSTLKAEIFAGRNFCRGIYFRDFGLKREIKFSEKYWNWLNRQKLFRGKQTFLFFIFLDFFCVLLSWSGSGTIGTTNKWT